MDALKPPHSHFVNAAEGWLELGNIAEARAELARIDEALQRHPQVLEVHWAICAQEKDWAQALEIASELVRTEPDLPFGWLHRAYAVRRAPGGGLEAAWKGLLPALDKFPHVPIIPYNLACYACQMQQLEKARELLQRSFAMGDKSQIQAMAMADDDLKPLWPEIRRL